MNILDIGGGFTGSEFQLKQVRGEHLGTISGLHCVMIHTLPLQLIPNL